MSSRFEWHPVAIVAAREFRDRLRNRWVLAAAAVFTTFALIIAYVGAAQQGEVGLRGIDVTIASLVSLVIYLVPLIALTLGFDSIVGERERGTLDLLLSMPITRLELLLGKYAGLSAALACATIGGFGVVGGLLLIKLPGTALIHYSGFMASAVLLGMAFLSLALMVSVIATDRTRASGMAVALWFFFVLVFDLLALGALVVGGDRLGGDVLPVLMLLNPADVFRLLNIFGFDDVRTLYGLATVFPARLASPFLLGSVMLAWIAAPLAIAGWKFHR
jgi:Cu-processing system permease protein